MDQEFEIISNNHENFNLFLVNLLYRNPHIHRELEFCLLLEGSLTLITQNQEFQVNKGELFVINSVQSHELKAESSALLISAQVAPSFFSSFFPQIRNCMFTSYVFRRELNPYLYDRLHESFVSLAQIYLNHEDRYELKAAGLIIYSLSLFLDVLPFRILSDREQSSNFSKAERMRQISEYIDANYTQKLLLSDIAKKMNLSLSYLSHFFKDCFGISFQDYLMKMRCERARQLLHMTDHSLLDICISSGFSDIKYFTSGFRQLYGYSPKKYRENFKHQEIEIQQKTMLTTQQVLSPQTSLIILDRYLKEQS